MTVTTARTEDPNRSALTATAPTTTAPTTSTHDLAVLVRRLASRPRSWRPLVRFTAAERYWVRLDASAGVDVWLLNWLPSQVTDLHDHGHSAAAFVVVDGGLTEVRVDPVLGSWSTTLHAPAVRIVGPGLVHDVRNDLLTPAVSIHAYSPPLSRMTYYDLQDGHLQPVREVATNEPEVAS